MTNLATWLRLMAVTDDLVVGGRDVVALCRDAERGGATSIQLRMKAVGPAELARAARAVIAGVGVPVLVNDRVDVALAVGAAGVHLGPDDLPPGRARALAPPGFIIGASVGSEREAGLAQAADYWGVGPWAVTATKADAGAAIGGEGFARLVALAAGRPCVAIGSVRPPDVASVIDAGGAGVAVVSGIFGAPDAATAAATYDAAFREALA